MTGSAGNVMRQAEDDSFVIVAVICDTEEYVCNHCEAGIGLPLCVVFCPIDLAASVRANLSRHIYIFPDKNLFVQYRPIKKLGLESLGPVILILADSITRKIVHQ